MKKNREFYLMAAVCGLAAATCSASAGRPPNVVFILADDLGWSDCTLYGGTKFYQTPNIERLSRMGMTFSRAYTDSPLCSPTRASLLTGQSVARHGISAPAGHLPRAVLKPSIADKAAPGTKTLVPETANRLDTALHTLGEAFRQSGYATGHFGKWHLGVSPHSPLEHGFDVDLPHDSGPGPRRGFVGVWNYPELKPRHPAEHIEDRMAEEAVKFIEANKDRPFFLNYWQFSVHAPFDAKKELIAKYRKLADPENPQRSPTYAAMVESMDDAVGSLLDALERHRLTDHTVIVFYSDNGGNMYNEIDGSTPTSNAPLRGGKATLWEGGIRVPCVIAWPGLTRPASRSDALVQTSDFFPTFADLLKIKTAPGQRFDGASISSVLAGGGSGRAALFVYFPHSPRVPDNLPPGIAVITGEWKLIRLFHDGEDRAHRHLLFNLKEDIGETRDLAGEQPARVSEMASLIDAHLREAAAVVPQPNPAYRPAAAGGGWLRDKGSALDSTGGRLVLTSSTNDPWVATLLPAVARKGPFTLRFRLKSGGAGAGQVLWRESARQPYNARERSTPFPPRHDGAFHDYAVELPASGLAGFRIDPGAGAGEYVIEGIRLENAAGAFFRWPPQE